METVDDCWDHIPIESFRSSMQIQVLDRQRGTILELSRAKAKCIQHVDAHFGASGALDYRRRGNTRSSCQRNPSHILVSAANPMGSTTNCEGCAIGTRSTHHGHNGLESNAGSQHAIGLEGVAGDSNARGRTGGWTSIADG